jgi:hypothetical protein
MWEQASELSKRRAKEVTTVILYTSLFMLIIKFFKYITQIYPGYLSKFIIILGILIFIFIFILLALLIYNTVIFGDHRHKDELLKDLINIFCSYHISKFIVLKISNILEYISRLIYG